MAFYLIQVAYKDTAAKTLIANPQTREDAIGKTCAIAGRQAAFVFLFIRRIRCRMYRRIAGQHRGCGICAGHLVEGRRLEIPHDGPDVSFRGLGGDEKGAKGRLRSSALDVRSLLHLRGCEA